MSRPRNTRATFPTDVFYPICEYLDPKTLRDLSLTCRRLVAPTRKRLFREILLGRWTTEPFLQLLASGSSFGALVHSLTIVDSLIFSPIATSLPFALFTNLRHLKLHSVDLRSWDQLFQRVLALVPSLQSLNCYTMTVQSQTIPIPQVPDSDGLVGQALSSPVSLASLTVANGSFDHSAFVEYILSANIAPRLRSLDISFGSTTRHLYWMPVIRSTSQTLEHVSISMSDAPIPASFPETLDAPHSYVFDALATVSRLCTLVIRYCPDPMIFNSTTRAWELLMSLSALLDRSPVPFPHLSALTLHLVDRGQAVDQPSLDRLAHALADTTRYPQFVRITVVVTSERWTRNVLSDLWLPARTRGEPREAMYKKWREACAGFEGREGVAVEVVVWPIEVS